MKSVPVNNAYVRCANPGEGDHGYASTFGWHHLDAEMAKKPAATPNYRNSETGRYTTKEKAERKPKEHEKEKRK